MNELINLADLDKKDFWIIEFEGVEWEYAIEKLVRALKLRDLAPSELAVLMAFNSETHVPAAWLRRKHVPASALMRMTGKPLEWIESETVIRLRVKPRPELPQPTVRYWGEA